MYGTVAVPLDARESEAAAPAVARPARGARPRWARRAYNGAWIVAAGAFVGPGCRVGPRTVLAPGVVLVADVVVGEDGWFHAGAILREGTRVGNRVVLQPGVVLGADGFGYVPDADGRPVAMAQRGCVVVEDDVEIGANTTVAPVATTPDIAVPE